MPPPFRVPPLRSGGLMLTWRCDSRCRHCQYRCGPGAGGGWMDDATLEASLATLAAEPLLSGIHLAGGEATLDPDRLERALGAARRHGVAVDYLETNGGFARDLPAARALFRRLARAGLRRALVSVSPYHNEFIPLARTRHALRAAAEELPGGAFAWVERFLPLLAALDPDRPHPLSEFLSVHGLAGGDPRLLAWFPLSTGGRAPEALRAFYRLRPAEAFAGERCGETLRDTGHFHVSPEGFLYTGHCPGLAPAPPEDPHAPLDAAAAPVLWALAEGGPCALAALARERAGFAPDPAGYASGCDLCWRARTALARTGGFPELRPAHLYAAAPEAPPAGEPPAPPPA